MSLGLGNVTTTYIGATGGLLRISATSGTVDLGSTNIRGGTAFNQPALVISGSNITVRTSGNVTAPVSVSADSISFPLGSLNCTFIVNNVGTRGIQCFGSFHTIQANNVTSTTGLSGSPINISATDSIVRANVATGGSAFNTPAITSSSRGNRLYIDTIVGGAGGTSAGINLGSANQLAVVREVYGGTGSPGISLSSTNTQSTVIVTGGVYASSLQPAIFSNSFDAFIKIKGPFVDSTARCAVQCVKFYTYDTIGLQTPMNMYDSTGAALNLNTYHSASPPPSDVRKGVGYGPNNQLIGTMSVPDPLSVAVGVPVDGATGSAVLTGSDVLSSEISSGVTIAERINNSATIASTGNQLQAGLS
jgi:hypothetical protein